MWCISAYKYVVGEAKMSKIFAVYFQASGFPSQSSEYTFGCCDKQFVRYGISLSYFSPGVDLVAFFVSSSYWCRFPSGVRCPHLLSPVLEARSVLLEFALSRWFSRRRMRCRVEYYILCISPSVGLRLGCGLSFFPFHLYVQFDVAHNQSVVTSNVALVDDCYVCGDVWPVCLDLVNVGLRYIVWAWYS